MIYAWGWDAVTDWASDKYEKTKDWASEKYNETKEYAKEKYEEGKDWYSGTDGMALKKSIFANSLDDIKKNIKDKTNTL